MRNIDFVGNVLSYTNNAGFYSTSQTYSYDNLYQLIQVDGVSQGDNTRGLNAYHGIYRQTFSFDTIGNMTSKISSAQQSLPQALGDELNYAFLEYNYIPGTRKLNNIGGMYYEYDLNGNLVRESFGEQSTNNNDGFTAMENDDIFSTNYGFALFNRSTVGTSGYERRYVWNERNFLINSSDSRYNVQYSYGADGQRAVKYSVTGNVANETLYFNRMFQVSQYAMHQLESKHIYLGETRILTKRGDFTVVNEIAERDRQYFYHGDHLGSAQLITDSRGFVYEHIEYTPYGELWVDRQTTEARNYPTVFRFTGKELDAETGLYYFGARYLDPRTSRWLSVDPAMYQGDYIPGAPINDDVRRNNNNLPGMGGIYNYVNMHVYHYGGNNPVMYIDPDGRNDEPFFTVYEPTTQQTAVYEHYFLSPNGPENNGARSLWAEAFLDNSDGSELHLSAGLISLGGETDTFIFVGGDFDLLNGSLDIGITNRGANFRMRASLISLEGRFGTKFPVGNRDVRIGAGGSIGIQAGFQLTIHNDELIFDAAFLWGVRFEVSWKKRE